MFYSCAFDSKKTCFSGATRLSWTSWHDQRSKSPGTGRDSGGPKPVPFWAFLREGYHLHYIIILQYLTFHLQWILQTQRFCLCLKGFGSVHEGRGVEFWPMTTPGNERWWANDKKLLWTNPCSNRQEKTQHKIFRKPALPGTFPKPSRKFNSSCCFSK